VGSQVEGEDLMKERCVELRLLRDVIEQEGAAGIDSMHPYSNLNRETSNPNLNIEQSTT
jgi:hypothetical protein